MLKQFLFRIAKAPFMGTVVGNAFHYASWAIPVKKIVTGPEVLAFQHPKPAYRNHIIITPKKTVRTLQQLSEEDFAKVWETAMAIVAAQHAYQDGFTLVANGGKRQEVQQVHFHLFTDHPLVSGFPSHGPLSLQPHPAPEWKIHFIATPPVLHCIDHLNAQFGIVQKGYSLVCQQSESDGPVCHIVSGKKLK